MNSGKKAVVAIMAVWGMVGAAWAADDVGKDGVLEHVGAVSLQRQGEKLVLANAQVGLRFDLRRYTYDVYLPATGETVLENAGMEANARDPSQQRDATCSQAWERVSDAAGQGLCLRFTIAFRHTAIPEYLFSYTLYDGDGAIRLGFGLKNTREFGIRLMRAEPLNNGRLKLSLQNPLTLNGGAGAAPTAVQPGFDRSSANSLMLTGLSEGRRRTLVWGGLANRDFGKWCSVGPPMRDSGKWAPLGLPRKGDKPTDILLSLRADDPVGRLVDPGQSYWAGDTFYLDVTTDDPFVALEKYGRAMRVANHANPKPYDFPVLCGWSVGVLSKLPAVNNSKLLIGELDAANACGLTRYTQVGIRLEPDKYNDDTEQGWWDDQHWAKYGHLVSPYETMAQWCKAIIQRNGIPYTYLQVGMPSDDYARAFPGHMLFNDISRLSVRHWHHEPLVSYDYTDPEFQKRTLAMWRRLRQDGMCGIKFDYPETGWAASGGFEDRHATTAFAYREIFRLAREGLGPGAFLDERNLGFGGRAPCLDLTAGLVDTQRNWTDSNAYVPAMVTISGLRWYKNRTVFNYFPDTKTVHDLSPAVRRSMLTMMFLTSGRLDLASSFKLFTPEIVHDISRIYPAYREPFTARPLDAFTGVKDPQVYDLELTPEWHQVALFNSGKEAGLVTVPLSGDRVSTGAIGLDPTAEYYVYDFWADQLVGKLPGTAKIKRKLDPLHCALLSVRKVQSHPQLLSTSRHVLQGWVELSDVEWDAAAGTLSGKAQVIGGELMRIAVACNGATAATASAQGAAARLEKHPAGESCACLVLERPENGEASWTIQFSK